LAFIVLLRCFEKEEEMKIHNAVVLVTGANRGLGLAFAREALARGAKTVYAAVRRPESVTEPGVTAVRLDVTNRDEAQELARQLTDVTVVINNAGILEVGNPLEARGHESLRRQFETNVFGVLHVSEAFAPAVIAGRGAILNVVSVGSWLGNPVVGSYATSKAAVWGLTNNLRRVLEPQGVTVTSLHVGYIDTDMVRGYDAPKMRPEDVVKVALDGLEAGADEVLADAMSRAIKEGLSRPDAAYLKGV
jgi:NAD(P)-dependent dehydrogenase (short-subunit alcohol dehydrogenase family)